MTPESFAESLERMARDTVVIRRAQGGTPPTFSDAVVPARIRQYGAQELTGGIVQGDYEIIVAAAHLVAQGFPGSPKKLDRVYLHPTVVNGVWTVGSGTPVTVQHPGDRGGGLGFWMQARGG